MTLKEFITQTENELYLKVHCPKCGKLCEGNLEEWIYCLNTIGNDEGHLSAGNTTVDEREIWKFIQEIKKCDDYN